MGAARNGVFGVRSAVGLSFLGSKNAGWAGTTPMPGEAGAEAPVRPVREVRAFIIALATPIALSLPFECFVSPAESLLNPDFPDLPRKSMGFARTVPRTEPRPLPGPKGAKTSERHIVVPPGEQTIIGGLVIPLA